MPTSILIGWYPAEGPADAYRIYYRKTAPPGQDLILASNVDVPPQPPPGSEILTFAVNRLDPDTEYELHVRTVAGEGELQEVSDDAVVVKSTGVYEENCIIRNLHR